MPKFDPPTLDVVLGIGAPLNRERRMSEQQPDRGKWTEYVNRIADLQRDLAAAQARTSRLNEQLRDERVMRNGLADEMTSLIEERDAAQAQIRELTASLDTMTRKMQRCSDERGAAQARVGELERECEAYRESNREHWRQWDAKIIEARADVNAARVEARALREALRDYGRHSEGCSGEFGDDYRCRCGWREFKSEHGEIWGLEAAAAAPSDAETSKHNSQLVQSYRALGMTDEPAPPSDARGGSES